MNRFITLPKTLIAAPSCLSPVETGHRRQDRYDLWRAGVARDSHPQKGDVPGHERCEDLSQGKETDHVHRAR